MANTPGQLLPFPPLTPRDSLHRPLYRCGPLQRHRYPPLQSGIASLPFSSSCNVTRASPEAQPSLTADAPSPSPPSPHQPLREKHGVLIVGGGPAGLAAALALSVSQGWTGVTVVEKASEIVPIDVQRSYIYGITGRSLNCAALFGVAEELKQAGFDSPSVTMTEVTREGKVTVMRRPFRDPSKISYLMPRPTFMRVLAQRLEQHNASAVKAEENITVLTDSTVVQLDRVPDYDGTGQRLAVTVRGKNEKEKTLYPSLVLGSDGINSVVRKTLHQWAEEAKDKEGKPTFGLTQHPSPSSGLRIKAMQIPREPLLKSRAVMENDSFVVLKGFLKGWHTYLAMFPVKDPLVPRTASIVTKPTHPLWGIPLGDTETYKEALREAFPQIDLEDQVGEEELAKFASSPGTVFPVPQATDGMSWVVQGSSKTSKDSSAVVLVGDSAHAFPPDLGQGVNAAMQDVQALVELLEMHGNDVAVAAEAYSSDRTPEAQALAELVQFGFPYQYRQEYWPAKLFTYRFMLRFLLSKCLGFLGVSPPCIFLMQDVSLRYSEVLRLDKKTRWVMGLLGISIVVSGVALVTRNVWRQK